MTTYWLVGEKPTNNNVQENNSNSTSDQNPQQPPKLDQIQGSQSSCTRNIINMTTGNGAPGNHPLLSPSHQRNSTTHSANPSSHLNQQFSPSPGSDNIPNHTESAANTPLLLSNGSSRA